MTFEYEDCAPVEWPIRRHSLLWYLYELATPSFQQKYWIEGRQADKGSIHGLSVVISFFFDDTDLGDQAERTPGTILTDELEVAAVQQVGRALNRVHDLVGAGKADFDYVSSPCWVDVIDAARNAYQLLRPRLEREGDDLLPPL